MVDDVGLAPALLFPAGHEDWITVYQGLQFGLAGGQGILTWRRRGNTLGRVQHTTDCHEDPLVHTHALGGGGSKDVLFQLPYTTHSKGIHPVRIPRELWLTTHHAS